MPFPHTGGVPGLMRVSVVSDAEANGIFVPLGGRVAVRAAFFDLDGVGAGGDIAADTLIDAVCEENDVEVCDGEIDAEAGNVFDVEAVMVTEAEEDAVTETEFEVEDDTETEADEEIVPVTELEVEMVTEPDPDAELDTELEPELEAEEGAVPVPEGVGKGAVPEPVPDTAAVPEPVPDAAAAVPEPVPDATAAVPEPVPVAPDAEPEPESEPEPVVVFETDCECATVKSAAMRDTTRRSLAGVILLFRYFFYLVISFSFPIKKRDERRAKG